MFTKSFSLMAASLFIGALALVGCKTDKHAEGTHTMPDGTTMAGTSHALMCPKCETVWTSDVIGQGSRSEKLSSKREMTCPTCDTMAAAYFLDGEKVLHDCPDCKVTPIPVNRSSEIHPLKRGT